MSELFFEMEKINKYYTIGEEQAHILKDICLTVSQGEYLSVLGPSGSGKSTLMNIIGCLDTATSGSYCLHGHEIEELDEKELARIRSREIGFVFQNSQLLPRLTAQKNVELPLIYAGVSPKERKHRASEMLKRVGLEDRMDYYPNQLSGGQQQRVALARTLNQSPTIILADEPVAALDPVTAHQVMSDFKRINEEMNISILINIHHVDLALKYADRVIGIRAGEIVYDGSTENVTQEVLDSIYNGAVIPEAGKE